MSKKNKLSKKTPGLPPGSIVYVGKERTHDVSIEYWQFNKNNIAKSDINMQLLEKLPYTNMSEWLNVVGIHNTAEIEQIGKLLHLHPLVLEDVVNTQQRPKCEETESTLFFTLKLFDYYPKSNELEEEQVSLVLTEHAVITFQEISKDVFNPVRDRLDNSKGRIRTAGPDYLFYALIDMIIDHYYVVLEKIGDFMERLEEQIFDDYTRISLQDIQLNKKQIVHLRKSIFPLREAIHRLKNLNSELIKNDTQPFINDMYDHTIQIIENIDSLREMNNSLRDAYISEQSNQMNNVMQVLTVIATIFIPLTFVAGIYGMNFDDMPELHWKYGYIYAWGLMLALGFAMVIYFRKKKWL